VFVRFGKMIVIAALVVSTGLHWAALQTVAWTTMLAANLGNESFSQAVSETFDGQHLCPLCRAIAAAKKSQQKNDITSLTQKLEFPPAAQNIVLVPPSQFELLPVTDSFANRASPKPLLQPPRQSLV
jgi:hypothetical protein